VLLLITNTILYITRLLSLHTHWAHVDWTRLVGGVCSCSSFSIQHTVYACTSALLLLTAAMLESCYGGGVTDNARVTASPYYTYDHAAWIVAAVGVHCVRMCAAADVFVHRIHRCTVRCTRRTIPLRACVASQVLCRRHILRAHVHTDDDHLFTKCFPERISPSPNRSRAHVHWFVRGEHATTKRMDCATSRPCTSGRACDDSH
jgi:hypothetical protein